LITLIIKLRITYEGEEHLLVRAKELQATGHLMGNWLENGDAKPG
jgi:hypothetical protein